MDDVSDSNHAAARHLTFETRAFVAGRFTPSLSGKTFGTYNPANVHKFAVVA